MGSFQCGRCQCQCYINYISCDYTRGQSEIITHERTNRFAESNNP